MNNQLHRTRLISVWIILLLALICSYLSGSAVVINEIMFKEASDNQEWIELYNRGEYTILMDDYYILDAANTRTRFSGSIEPNQYIVICRYKEELLYYYHHLKPDDVIEAVSWAILNNDRETIWLIDNNGTVLDSMSYTAPASYPRDVSLERINPNLPPASENWGQSIDASGSTPGLQNSIYTESIPAKSNINISPNPFSPSRGEVTIVSYDFPERLNRVTCRIFDLKGRLVNTLLNQQMQAASGTVIWNGYRDNGERLPVGIYIVLIEAAGYDTETVFTERKTVVIGK